MHTESNKPKMNRHLDQPGYLQLYASSKIICIMTGILQRQKTISNPARGLDLAEGVNGHPTAGDAGKKSDYVFSMVSGLPWFTYGSSMI